MLHENKKGFKVVKVIFMRVMQLFQVFYRFDRLKYKFLKKKDESNR